MSKPNTSIVDQHFNKWRLDHVNDPLRARPRVPEDFLVVDLSDHGKQKFLLKFMTTRLPSV